MQGLLFDRGGKRSATAGSQDGHRVLQKMNGEKCKSARSRQLSGRADQLAGVGPVRRSASAPGPGLALQAARVTGHGTRAGATVNMDVVVGARVSRRNRLEAFQTRKAPHR